MAQPAAVSVPQKEPEFPTLLSTDTYHIEAVPLATVKALDKDRFNNNNVWPNQTRPQDYNQVMEASHTKHWITALKPDHGRFVLFSRDRKWMHKAAAIGHTTGHFPKMYEDELEASVLTYAKEWQYFSRLTTPTPWFVRTDTASLKYGMHGTGPYYHLRDILESLVTSTAGHCPLGDDPNAGPLTLYLIPWQPLVLDQEFRVFVCNRQVTSISQQHLYRPNSVLEALESDEERVKRIVGWIETITAFHASVIAPGIPLDHQTQYTVDLSILQDGTPYFIDINPFGSEQAAGSALFHWVLDRHHLYGTPSGPAVSDPTTAQISSASASKHVVAFRYTTSA